MVAVPIMDYQELRKQFVRVWRAAGVFFQSIEVCLVLLMAFVMVGGVWLAFLGDPRSLAAFALVIAYFTVRPILHVKGILSWPFL